MANIFDYFTWRGDLTLAQDSMNEIDAVILARFAYIPFECIELQMKGGGVTIGEAAEALLQVSDIETRVMWQEDIQILHMLRGSVRFQNMRLLEYVNTIDEESQTQFAAITIALPDGRYCISYRGTDDTLVGWKEDFNMSFVTPVKGQLLAVEYLERVASLMQGELVVTGHSKGGNFAVYAAAFCKKDVQDRILAIYNYDGPGYHDTVFTSEEYARICDRVSTYIPQSSIFGMLMGRQETHSIVQSSEKGGFLQHDICTWQLDGPRFVILEETTASSKFVDHTIKEWLKKVDKEKRETVATVLYEMVLKTNAGTLSELTEDPLNHFKTIRKSFRDLDEETKMLLTQAMDALKESARTSMDYVRKDNKGEV